MKIIKILESIEVNNACDRTVLIERLKFWINETRDSEFSCKEIRDGMYSHIVLVNRRKTRSDAGKERVNRTGFRRGINPLPRNLDKIPAFYKKG